MSHSNAFFVNVLKSIILGNFYRHLAIFFWSHFTGGTKVLREKFKEFKSSLFHNEKMYATSALGSTDGGHVVRGSMLMLTPTHLCYYIIK